MRRLHGLTVNPRNLCRAIAAYGRDSLDDLRHGSVVTPLPLLYEDEFLIAIDKPAGMLVHPGPEPEAIEWIAMKRLREQLGRRVFPLHRLDRPTTGVLLFALDKKTAGQVQQAFEQRKVLKVYHAVVEGLAPQKWRSDTPLAKNPEGDLLEAETSFECLAVSPELAFSEMSLRLSLVRAVPATGRFHQIRLHLLEAGLPIVGDFRYAGQKRSFELGAVLGTGTRMLLQAKRLEIDHPWTGERLEIEASTDRDFCRCFPDLGDR